MNAFEELQMGTQALLDAAEHVYARPGGWHYHIDRNCIMLSGDDFEELNYTEIQKGDVAKRELCPCPGCAYEKGSRIR